MKSLRDVVLSGLLAAWGLLAGANPLSSPLLAEQTGFAQSGPYAEVARFCHGLQRSHPASVKCFKMGVTAQGRDIKSMVVSKSGVLSAKVAKQQKVPVVLVIGGTHAGEIDGKDAGLMLIRVQPFAPDGGGVCPRFQCGRPRKAQQVQPAQSKWPPGDRPENHGLAHQLEPRLDDGASR